MMKELQIIKTEFKIGLEAPVRLLHVTDSHICLANEADAAYDPELIDHAKQRGDCFGGEAQVESYFEQALDYARSENIPMLHTGDLYDCLTEANLAYMEKALSSVDSIYAAGNHDFCHFVGRAIEDYPYKWENLRRVQPHVKQNLYFDSRIIGGVNIVTLDDGYYLFNKGQEEMLRAEAAKGYPIVLCMHVPLYTPELARVGDGVAYVLGAPEEILETYTEKRRKQQTPVEATLRAVAYIENEPRIKAILYSIIYPLLLLSES